MEELPRQKLHDLIAAHGKALCDDPRRCEGLLRDVCPAHRREVNLLVMALKAGVPTGLLDASASTPVAVLHARLTDRLKDDLSLAEDAARWAVGAWAFALGLQEPPRHDPAPRPPKRAPVEAETKPPVTPPPAPKATPKSTPKPTPRPPGPSSSTASAHDAFRRGNIHYDNGEYDRAITEFNEAIRLDPNSPGVFNNRGNAYESKREYDRALADFNEAIRLAPNDADAFNNRGIVHAAKGELDLAIADYDQAIRLAPNFASAFSNRGNAYRRKGDPPRAILDFDQAIKINPQYADAFNNRGNAYRDQDKYEHALQDYERALTINPRHANALQNKAALKSQASRGMIGMAIVVLAVAAAALYGCFTR